MLLKISTISTDIFGAMLVDGEMHGPKRPSTNLLLDDILIDAMLPLAVVRAVGELGSSIERFLGDISCTRLEGNRFLIERVEQIRRSHTFTRRGVEGCRW